MNWFDHQYRRRVSLVVIVAVIAVSIIQTPISSAQSISYSPLSWLNFQLPTPAASSMVAASFNGLLGQMKWSFGRTVAGLFGWFGKSEVPPPPPIVPPPPPLFKNPTPHCPATHSLFSIPTPIPTYPPARNNSNLSNYTEPRTPPRQS